MQHIKSIIEEVISEVYKTQSLEVGKKLMKDLISQTKIKEQDKNKMLREVDNCQSLVKLQFYATNAMFKFEGLSVNSVIYK